MAYTTIMRQEDKAAYTWLCLVAVTFERELVPLDEALKVKFLSFY